MLLPYSTDAPIYHFPWMTIVLIVINIVTFGLTDMGRSSEGWLLQYGHGLHPVEWLAYSFLHFGPMHLIGNMFFLWAFGIVVEGKLGWWKFLSVYLVIGVTGGFLIQVAMLGYRIPLEDLARRPDAAPQTAWWEPASANAQDEISNTPLMDDDQEMIPGENRDPMGDDRELTPLEKAQIHQLLSASLKPGAGGASLIVFALLGIVLIWAPKNEVECLMTIGFRVDSVEIEYLYFCGFKIACELLGMIFGIRGFEVTSEVAHLLGAVLGVGVGSLFVKMNWVDCENWDLFAYMQNKHGSLEQVGAWQDAALMSHRRRNMVVASLDDLNSEVSKPAKAKKKRIRSKLVALESLDDDLPEEPVAEIPAEFNELVEAAAEEEFVKNTPGAKSSRTRGTETTVDREPTRTPSPLKSIRRALQESRFSEALAEFRRQKTADRSFELPQIELGILADGFFKAHNVRDSRVFLEEYIRRFPEDSDRKRVKLAVLYVKSLKKPAAALKLLAMVDRGHLPDDFATIHQQASRHAQQMIADGVVDAH